MGLLNKLTVKNLKLNKRRTIVTIVGIVLSVALLTSVATMYASCVKSIIEFEKYQKGDFHIELYDVPANNVIDIESNRNVDNVCITKDIGFALLPGSKNDYKRYAFIKGFTKESFETLSIHLTKGRFPRNEKEIAVPTHLINDSRANYQIGDTVTFDVGDRSVNGSVIDKLSKFSNGKEAIINTAKKSYKIVGIIERPDTILEDYDSPAYTVLTYFDGKLNNGKVDTFVRLKKKSIKNYEAVTACMMGMDQTVVKQYFDAKKKDYKNGVVQDDELQKKFDKEMENAKYEVNVNEYLILLQNNPLNIQSLNSLAKGAFVICIIIILASVFCIKNSFDISITEKIKQYGMLRSVGATKRQIRQNVLYEATVLGVIGIPLGVILGIVASLVLIILSNSLLKEMLNSGVVRFAISPVAIIIAVVLGGVTVYLSSLKSAFKASKVTPIDSIRNSAGVKIRAKKIKSNRIIKKLFGIGGDISHKNIKRNNKKYRTTVISIIVSVFIFIGVSYFVEAAFSSVKSEINDYDYNLSVTVNENKYNGSLKDNLLQTVKFDNVDDYAITREDTFFIHNAKLNKEYKSAVISDGKLQDIDAAIVTVGDYKYKKYLKKLNISYDYAKDKAIIYNLSRVDKVYENGKSKSKYIKVTDYKKGDNFEYYTESSNGEKAKGNIEVAGVTSELPYKEFVTVDVAVILSDSTFDKIVPNDVGATVYYHSDEVNKLQKSVKDILGDESYSINNNEENARMAANFFRLIAIFLYGFIVVVTLIGVTNIFNTITTSMSLRKGEFATLKSVGMTSKEFNRMIMLESVFIGAKALFYGIALGITICFIEYVLILKDLGTAFYVPIVPIVIAIVAVNLLILVIMNYSIRNVNKHNIIETIRNENI